MSTFMDTTDSGEGEAGAEACLEEGGRAVGDDAVALHLSEAQPAVTRAAFHGLPRQDLHGAPPPRVNLVVHLRFMHMRSCMCSCVHAIMHSTRVKTEGPAMHKLCNPKLWSSSSTAMQYGTTVVIRSTVSTQDERTYIVVSFYTFLGSKPVALPQLGMQGGIHTFENANL